MSFNKPRRRQSRSRYARSKTGRAPGRTGKPPINVGDVMEVQIVELSRRGDGIARVKGFIIFVPGTKPGDQVRIKIKRVGQTYAVAELASGEENVEEAAVETEYAEE